MCATKNLEENRIFINSYILFLKMLLKKIVWK